MDLAAERAAASRLWQELDSLGREADDRPYLSHLLKLWVADSPAGPEATSAALYLEAGGVLELELSTGEVDFPDEIALSEGTPAGLRLLPIPGGALAATTATATTGATAATGGGPEDRQDGGIAEPLRANPWALLLAAAARSCQLKRQLKEQHFQVNYRGVELEVLYDVGLAVAATLDLDQLSEEILLRAVSLLDARRGALYLVDGNAYRPARTFGGEAGPELALDDPALAAFLAGATTPPAGLLPGARHFLGVPIAIDNSPRGFLAAGDKESRRGVGPFPAGDRRTLGLFANQAAIALENARLHRQALEKERLERELVLAAEIQRQILPKGSPAVPGYELVGWNRPARQVGGDYYDLLLREEGRVSLALGDVSGKGMPAALMVSTLHSALRLLLDRTGLGPAFLERLNSHILESSAANKFITLFLAELEPETGTVHYLNAGHNPALLLRAGGEVLELESSGLPIGLLPGSRYRKDTVHLEVGDVLCLYSDGITECASPADEEFGTDRLIALLRTHPGRPLTDLLASIAQATVDFAAGAPQLDDETVVLLRREG